MPTDTATKQRRWYAFLCAAGICQKCPAKAAPGHTYCPACLEKNNRRTRAKRKALVLAGLCERGCGRPREDVHLRCKTCRRLARKFNRLHWREFPSRRKSGVES